MAALGPWWWLWKAALAIMFIGWALRLREINRRSLVMRFLCCGALIS
jgi:hypothetical protein